jgi:hypothetical protein
MAGAEHVLRSGDLLVRAVRRVVDSALELARLEPLRVVAGARDQQHLAVVEDDGVHGADRVLGGQHVPLAVGALLGRAGAHRVGDRVGDLVHRVVVGGRGAGAVDGDAPADAVGARRDLGGTDRRLRPTRADRQGLEVGPVLPAGGRVVPEEGERGVRGRRLVPEPEVVLLADADDRRALGGLGDQRLAVALGTAGQLDLHGLGAGVGVGDGREGEVVVAPAGLLPAVRHVVRASWARGLEAGVLHEVGGGGGLGDGEEQSRGEGSHGQQGRVSSGAGGSSAGGSSEHQLVLLAVRLPA